MGRNAPPVLNLLKLSVSVRFHFHGVVLQLCLIWSCLLNLRDEGA